MRVIILGIIFSICSLTVLGQVDQDPLLQEQIPIPTPQPTQTPQQQKPLPPFTFQFNQETLYTFRYEAGAILAIMSYLILYKRGKALNAEIVQNFYNKTKDIIENNFQHIGFSKQNNASPFVGDSPSDVMFYASGRNNCNFMQMNFAMRKRQDLIYYLFYEAIYPQKDTVTIDIPVQADHPIVICLAQKKKVKTLTEKYLDIAQLTGTFVVKNIPQKFSILGESADIVDQIIDNQMIRKLQDLSNLIVSIHYTDQKMFSESSGHLRVVMNLSKKNQDKYQAGIDLVLYFVDKMAGLKVSSSYKTKALKSRQAFNATKQKQALQRHRQQMRKQKQQKKRQQQAWLRSLPPQKQKREDQKRKKKQYQKMTKSKNMKVM